MCSYMMNISSESMGGAAVVPVGVVLVGGVDLQEIYSGLKYISIKPSDTINLSNSKMSIQDFITTQAMNNSIFDSLPRITKEQFYDLTT